MREWRVDDSPDLNPIEMPSSKMKAYLGKLSERSISGLCKRVRSFPSFDRHGMHELFLACKVIYDRSSVEHFLRVARYYSRELRSQPRLGQSREVPDPTERC
jgi:hypothetical protein